MARPKSENLTDTEQSIMKILWRDGECSVKAITAVLSEVKITAYTSVQTMCKIMAEKGYVEFRKDGRAFLYSAVLSETDAQQSALKTLLNRFFGGSSQLLTQHLMTQSDIDMDALQELQDKLDRKSKDDK
ncbi:MAG: BlaI/MecI/CopY family transcriptional regulator [Psychrobium sp.]|nr:BlaI/MecI/CopY family transcriptional regulator [Psychrobium sp.]